ncbi:MAG: hypothetical protein JXR25_17310 [Pontiellaceae bacterium]|nr:hypothetical protein [Pontiellaceae bacterium]MBN2786579.1 hypothetical protein [Pontiellaceae bacterium]
MAVLLMSVGGASAEIVLIQAEDAVMLGTNYVVLADTNAPPYAFETNYITPVATDTGPAVFSRAVYEVENLTSNATYDLYMRVHVGPDGYSDDSIFVNTAGFGTNSVNFAYQNGIAGRTGLDGQSCSAAGFHWIKMNGEGDLGGLGPFTYPGTNTHFLIAAREDGLDVDALAFVTADLPVTDAMLNPSNTTVEVWPVGGIPEGQTADSTPLIEAYFLHGAGSVDTNAIAMTLDGSSVTTYTTAYTNFITTVSYTPADELALDVTHTASVVVATSPGGSFVTNEFMFYVGYPITYVDVTTNNTLMATTNSGPVGAGIPFETVSTNGVSLWRVRTDFGVGESVTNEPAADDYDPPYSGEHSVYESHGGSDCPRLKTTMYVSETNTYNVYTYLWDNGAGWDIAAGLTDTTNALTAYNASSTNAVALFDVGPDFWGTHTLYRVFIGVVQIMDTNTPIVVYMEDVPLSGDRTWIDGIGYQPLAGDGPPPGPTIDPDIRSLSIADGIAYLTWTSEAVGTYAIMHKTNINQSTWTPVKTGIPGGESTTTDSVSLSGAEREFFMIEGN